jgi:hypothetical protein
VLFFRVIGVASHTTVREVLLSSHDAGAQRRLTRSLLATGGENCTIETVEVNRQSFWNASVRSTAYASCSAAGSGAQSLVGFAFPSEQDLHEWVDASVDYVNSIEPSGLCEGDAGQSEWADRTNTVRGTLVCFVTPEGVAEVVWANFSTRMGYVAYSRQDDIGAVFDWWEEHARGEVFSAAGERVLRQLYNGEIRGGLSACHRGRSPLANVVLACEGVHVADDPDAFADTVTLYYFATSAQLNTWYSAYASEFHAPERDNGLECGRAPLVASTYGDPTEGRCFEFVAPDGEDGALWLLWTHDRQRIAVVASRSDENTTELARIWNDLY